MKCASRATNKVHIYVPCVHFSCGITSSTLTSFPPHSLVSRDHMIQVEETDSHHGVPEYTELDRVRQEMNDASSVGTVQSRSSTLQLRSKYQYRSPLEQEVYASQGTLTPREAGENSSFRSSQSEPTRHRVLNSARPSWRQSNTLTPPTLHHRLRVEVPPRNSSSPTDTVDSFEYQSHSQIMADMERLASSQHFRHGSHNVLHPSHNLGYNHVHSQGVPAELSCRVPPTDHPLKQKQTAVNTSLLHPPSSLPCRMQASPAMHSNTISFPQQHKLHSELQREFRIAPQSPPPSAKPAAASSSHISHSPSQSSNMSSPSRVSMLSSSKSSQSSSPKKRQTDLAFLTALPISEKAHAGPRAPLPVSVPVPPHLQASIPLENGGITLPPSHYLPNEGHTSEPSHRMANIHRQPTKLAEEEEKKAIMQRMQQKHRNRGYHQHASTMIPLGTVMSLPHSAGIPRKYTPKDSTFV